MVTSSHDGTARLWDAYTGKPLGEPIPVGQRAIVRLSPDQRWLLAFEEDRVRLWDIRAGQARPLAIQPEETLNLGIHNHVVLARFDPLGKRIFTVSRESSTAPNWVTGVGFRPGDDRPASARFWNAENGLPLTEPLRHRGRI